MLTPTQTFPVQGDPPLHVSPKVSPKAPSPPKQYTCRYCKRKFKRNQELCRHLSNLPHSIWCPLVLCPWTGHRQYNLKQHMKVHSDLDPGRKPERKEYQIYDPEELVKSMADSTLTVESVSDSALSVVKKRFRVDKVGVEANVWGS